MIYLDRLSRSRSANNPLKQAIRTIEYPNSSPNPQDCMSYTVGNGEVTEIRRIEKKGPMDYESWFQVRAGEDVIAEIKESVCNVYYQREADR